MKQGLFVVVFFIMIRFIQISTMDDSSLSARLNKVADYNQKTYSLSSDLGQQCRSCCNNCHYCCVECAIPCLRQTCHKCILPGAQEAGRVCWNYKKSVATYVCLSCIYSAVSQEAFYMSPNVSGSMF